MHNIYPNKQEDDLKVMESTFLFANAADGIEICHGTFLSSIKGKIPRVRKFITSNDKRVKEGEITSEFKISVMDEKKVYVI